jgi:hypothetical protein
MAAQSLAQELELLRLRDGDLCGETVAAVRIRVELST